MALRERTLEEKLQLFATRWRDRPGNEKSNAQSFLKELLEDYGVEFLPGEVFEQVPVTVEEGAESLFPGQEQARRHKGFMDLYLRRICVWEMKGEAEKDLEKHLPQVKGYWEKVRTKYMVLCNFRRFLIYDTDLPDGLLRPTVQFSLEELPANAGALRFLLGEPAYYALKPQKVTLDVAKHIGLIVRRLEDEGRLKGQDRNRIIKFILECVFAMFGEDSGILPRTIFTNALKVAQANGILSPVYELFDDFGREREAERQPGVPYINGPLYDRDYPKLAEAKTILADLFAAASFFEWQYVQPEIFGFIFERSLHAESRHELGAHFTRVEDILRVVRPTIIRPWQERVEACNDIKTAEALVERMKNFHILDPACGSGNFLYIAYREMKGLEFELRQRWDSFFKRRADRRPPPPGPWFRIQQLHGIDKDALAVQLTRVVLWIGEHLAKLEFELDENTLPLTSLSDNILEGDALLLSDEEYREARAADPGASRRRQWFRPPQGELAIVSNPPFLGSKKLRLLLGDNYVDALHAAYPGNRSADLVTYWYPQALAALRPGERAGYVSTNSIAQNESREASLDQIRAAGGSIYEAYRSYPWPGDAAVHVSIINWVLDAGYNGPVRLDGNSVFAISPALRSDADVTRVAALAGNLGLSYQGVIPGNKEFILEPEAARRLIKEDKKSAAVIKPFLIGADLNRRPDQSPSRFIIDFGFMEQDEARRYKSAYAYVEAHVYPKRAAGLDRKSEKLRARWWQMSAPRGEMRDALSAVEVYLATANVSPHLMFSFVDKGILPDHQLIVLPLPTFYHFAVLQSAVHEAWAWARGSTLKGDLRYTNTTIFETFPFPLHPSTWEGARHIKGKPAPADLYAPRQAPITRHAEAAAAAGEKLYAFRAQLCAKYQLGLTKLANLVKGKDAPLKAMRKDIEKLTRLHDELNSAVCACYGWLPGEWRDTDTVLRQLLELNQRISAGD